MPKSIVVDVNHSENESLKARIKSLWQSGTLNRSFAIFFLALSFVSVLLSMTTKNCHIYAENFDFTSAALKTPPGQILKYMFDDQIMDKGVSRVTRPLSHFFLYFDSYFRDFFSEQLPQFPTLSILWLLNLVLLPALFFALLKKLKIRQNSAILATGILMLSASNLDGLWLYIRLAKPLAFVSIVFAMYFSFYITEKSLDLKTKPVQLVFFHLLCFAIFLLDETALLVYPFIFFFNGEFFKRRINLVLAGLMYLLLAACWFWFFPAVSSQLLQKNQISVLNYSVFNATFDFQLNSLYSLFTQTLLSIAGTFGIYPYLGELDSRLRFFEIVKWLGVLSSVLWILSIVCFRTKKMPPIVLRSLLFLPFLILSHWLSIRGLHESHVNFHYGVHVPFGIILVMVVLLDYCLASYFSAILYCGLGFSAFFMAKDLNYQFYYAANGSSVFGNHALDSIRSGRNSKLILDIAKNNLKLARGQMDPLKVAYLWQEEKVDPNTVYGSSPNSNPADKAKVTAPLSLTGFHFFTNKETFPTLTSDSIKKYSTRASGELNALRVQNFNSSKLNLPFSMFLKIPRPLSPGQHIFEWSNCDRDQFSLHVPIDAPSSLVFTFGDIDFDLLKVSLDASSRPLIVGIRRTANLIEFVIDGKVFTKTTKVLFAENQSFDFWFHGKSNCNSNVDAARSDIIFIEKALSDKDFFTVINLNL